ncbi:hypothetical protein CA602_19305 [Paraburkholderia hospita]|nr:hypothetical protein CA602_19305 [Paraburkholderia hospita]
MEISANDTPCRECAAAVHTHGVLDVQARGIRRPRAFAAESPRRCGTGDAQENKRGTDVPAIFISYRRIDSKAYAGRLFDRLSQHFGADHVFMDIEGGIQRGEDFADALQRAVESVDAMIILIGRQWLTCTGHNGRRRLDQPDDWVRPGNGHRAAARHSGPACTGRRREHAGRGRPARGHPRACAASGERDQRHSLELRRIADRRDPRTQAAPLTVAPRAGTPRGHSAGRTGHRRSRHRLLPLASAVHTVPIHNCHHQHGQQRFDRRGPLPAPPVASRPADPTAPADLSGFWRDDEGALYKVVSDSSGGFDMARIEPPEKDPTYRKIDLHGRDVEIAIGVLPSGTQQERADMELSIDGRFMTGLRKSTQIEDTATNWVLRRADPPQAGSASSAADTSGRSAPQAGYQTFSDPKYTFSYPANEFTFKKISDHSGHDGIEARSVHGNAFIQILTSDSINAESTQSLYDAWIVSCAKSPPPYHVVKPGRIIVSCLQSSGNGDVVYRYKLLGSDVGVTLLMRYPESEKQQWDSVVANIQRSLKLTD